MAILKSAKKALRQSQRRKAQNLAYKKKIKTLLKKGRDEQDLPQIYKALDKAAKAGVIKKNRASRIKSRLSKGVVKVRL